MSEWRDIETAPDDGTMVFLNAPGWPVPQVGHFEGDGEGSGVWVLTASDNEAPEPTMWRPHQGALN